MSRPGSSRVSSNPVSKPVGNRVQIVTDSSSQMPPELAERLGVEVVPVHVSVGGVDQLEGVELNVDDFYRQLEACAELPEILTTQPTPAQFVEAFASAAAAGFDEVLAILVGSDYSGTVNSAALAADQATVPVRVVDTRSASFGVGCCVWAAAEVLAAGGSGVDAAVAAEARAADVESVFVLQGLELARQSGRFGTIDSEIDEASEIAVLWSGQGALEVIASVHTVDEAVDAMVERMASAGRPLIAAIGRAGDQTSTITDLFRRRVEALPLVQEMVEYRVGPSIAAHTGPGTAGGFYFPA